MDPTVTSNVVTYTVVIKAENPDLKLKPGLTATISIYILELRDVLTAEAKAMNFKPSMDVLMAYNEQEQLSPSAPKGPPESTGDTERTMVWVREDNGAITPKAVTIGASDGVNVQILSSLEEGEKLVYSLKSESNSEVKSTATESESPFMPKPPGGKK